MPRIRSAWRPLAALVHGFSTAGLPRFEITHYHEHALSSGEAAAAIAYIQIKDGQGRSRWGAGVDTNIELASIKAVLSALNRSSNPAPQERVPDTKKSLPGTNLSV